MSSNPIGEAKVFYIGPHAPALSPDDVQLVHRLWLNMRRDPSVSDLHHSDIITYALTRLASQYAREKTDVLRELRNCRAANSVENALPAPSSGIPPEHPSDSPENATRLR